MKPEFLSVDDILTIHEIQIREFGGSAGVRDLGLLASAAAQAMSTSGGQFLHRDLAAIAAAYLCSLVKNHPFVDGTKRVGLASAMTFLDLDGVTIDHSSDILYDLTIRVAEGRLCKDDLAGTFRELARTDR